MAELPTAGPAGQPDALSGAADGCRHFLDPEAMTAEERVDRIIELLAVASVRLAQKERETAPAPTEKGLDCSGNCL